MAVIKHFAIKNANYTKALEYLMYEHKSSGALLRDEEGRPVPRERYILDGINCSAFSFDKECEMTNWEFHKNQTREEVKAHHYILSFDPWDSVDCGLTPERAHALGMAFAKRNFPGHQILVGTHADGATGSGNIHVHMVLNSVRKLDVERQPFMERETDCHAGYKHHETKEYMKHLKADVMQMCRQEGLHQVDLLAPARERVTDREYRAERRGQEDLDKLNRQIVAAGMKPAQTRFQTQKQVLRDAISETAAQASSLEEFRRLLMDHYRIEMKEQRGVFSYLHPDRKKYIRGRSLGTDYEKEHVLEMIRKGIREREQTEAEKAEVKEKAFRDPDTVTFLGVRYSTRYDPAYNYHADPIAILFVHSELRLVTDLQTCIKAQQSEAYARKVKLTNLQEMARTVLYLQEHGIGSREELRRERNKAGEKASAAQHALEKTEEQIRKINEKIHFAGQYYSTKAVHKEYRNALFKPWFRSQHRGELDRYDEAVSYFRNRIGEKIPPMKELKQRKEDLLEQKARQENAHRNAVREREELKKAVYNVNWILNSEKAREQNARKAKEKGAIARSADYSL